MFLTIKYRKESNVLPSLAASTPLPQVRVMFYMESSRSLFLSPSEDGKIAGPETGLWHARVTLYPERRQRYTIYSALTRLAHARFEL
jgi:hypothetical protein